MAGQGACVLEPEAARHLGGPGAGGQQPEVTTGHYIEPGRGYTGRGEVGVQAARHTSAVQVGISAEAASVRAPGEGRRARGAHERAGAQVRERGSAPGWC